LVDSGGAVPIRRIAGEVGWSHKHLIARFKRQVGLPPKTAARLVRFERAQRRLDRRGQTSWADIAAESGYADQAHLVREFRDFTGTTPTGFVTHGRAA
jgi:AraC-like DNA-binding protein